MADANGIAAQLRMPYQLVEASVDVALFTFVVEKDVTCEKGYGRVARRRTRGAVRGRAAVEE